MNCCLCSCFVLYSSTVYFAFPPPLREEAVQVMQHGSEMLLGVFRYEATNPSTTLLVSSLLQNYVINTSAFIPVHVFSPNTLTLPIALLYSLTVSLCTHWYINRFIYSLQNPTTQSAPMCCSVHKNICDMIFLSVQIFRGTLSITVSPERK